ncbi:MAG: AmmeMemoRadiSam system protein A [Halorhabdus sp.]
MATGTETPRIDRSTGAQLVEHARGIVEAIVLDKETPPPPSLSVCDQRRGVFVTLYRDGTLRGCIGRPRPEQPLSEALETAATGATTSDPRFQPLSPDELDAVTVSVSVLTPPETLADPRPEDIDVGRDGVIVANGAQSGLLLPQVAVEEGWSAEELLRRTARKAGLRPAAWQADETTVKRFSAQVFAEESPHGPVTVEDYTRNGTEESTD